MTVYCYDLVPLRTSTRWTRAQDDVMRKEYFPGLDPLMLIGSLREVGPVPPQPKMAARCISNRLSELGLRNRMTGVSMKGKKQN